MLKYQNCIETKTIYDKNIMKKSQLKQFLKEEIRKILTELQPSVLKRINDYIDNTHHMESNSFLDDFNIPDHAPFNPIYQLRDMVDGFLDSPEGSEAEEVFRDTLVWRLETSGEGFTKQQIEEYMRLLKLRRDREQIGGVKLSETSVIKKSQLKQFLKEEIRKILTEQSNNPETIILPINIYYINGNSETRNIGLDEGVITEPELMTTLWGEYQQMQDFERLTKSGGDKYTNMMQDIGLGTNSKVDANKMFFGKTMETLLNSIELYIPEGTEGTKEREFKNPYNGFTYGIYYDEEGNDFKYSKQETDKYQYMLMDDDEFKDFSNTIKLTID
jgi:hypothetical protein